MKKLIFSAAMLLFASNMFANDVYLSSTGVDSDAPNAGTEAAPVKTLAKAYALVNGGGTIHVSGMITLSSVLTLEKNDVKFVGSNVATDGFDGNNATSAFYGLNMTTRFTNLSFINGSNDGTKDVDNEEGHKGKGGIIKFKGGTSYYTNCVFHDNNAKQGAAISGINHNLRITDCKFYGNTTSGEGGAVKIEGGSITVDGSEFYNNTCTNGNGGALRIHVATPNITNSSFYNNSSNEGGAIDVRGTTVTIDNCVFHDNIANTNSGGAIVSFDNAAGSEIKNSKFYKNTTTNGQGGAVLTRCPLNITNCEMYENTAKDGGAISIENDKAVSVVENCNIHDNIAQACAGGIEVFGVTSVIVLNTTISNNRINGDWGGGIRVRGDSKSFKLLQSVVSGNVSHTHAGGLFFDLSGNVAQEIILAGSTITKNDCTQAGGAMFIGGTAREDHVFEIINCTITDNYTDNNIGNCPGINYQGDAGVKKTNLKIYNSILEGNYSRANNRYSDAWFKNAPVTIKNSVVGYIYERDQSSYIATETNSQVNTTPGNGRPELYSMLSPLVNDSYYQVLDISPAVEMGDATLATGYKDQLGKAIGAVVGAVQETTTNHGRGLVIPGTIEAPDYDYGGANSAYGGFEAGQTPNRGGVNIGWCNPSCWVNYTVEVENDGYYNVTVETAHAAAKNSFSISCDNVKICDIEVDGTGDYSNWATKENVAQVYLTKGTHIIQWNNFHDINIKSVTFTASPKKDITVTAAGYATYFDSTKDYVVAPSVEAYIFTKDTKELEMISDGIIPAGTGVVLKAAAGTISLYETETTNVISNNALHGSDAAAPTSVTGDNYYYMLSLNAAHEASSVGFYWGAAEGAAFENGAHKAYLALPKSSGAKCYLFEGENEETAVESVMVNEREGDNVMYNIAGQRVNANAKGIVIKNGKKYLVK